MGTELTTAANSTELSVFSRIADPLAFMKEAGHQFAVAGVCGVKNDAQGQVLALACLSERTHPLAIGRKYHIIEGKMSMRADAMLSDLRAAKGSYKVLSRTPEKASIEITHQGNTGTFTMTIADAKAENYYYCKDGKTPKDNWATPRGQMQMLWARVCSDGIRTMAPEVVAGTYTPEEIADLTPEAAPTVQVVRTPEEIEARRKEIEAGTAVVAKPAADPVIDVKAEPAMTGVAQVGAPPTAAPTAPAKPAGPDVTAMLLEIQSIVTGNGNTMEQLFQSIAKTHPEWKSMEDVPSDKLEILLNNLRAQAANSKK